jgi:hydroxymethylbilane synthase
METLVSDQPSPSAVTPVAGEAPVLRLGTRASALARWQAEWVATRLADLGVRTQLVPITTKGDVTSGPLGAMGQQGVFTKEIQRSLVAGEIDLAVHSLKDLPTEPVAGLSLAAVPPREKNHDALVASRAAGLARLPPGARVGTGSIRRRAQLLHLRPDLEVLDIRGNVDTRLRQLDDGRYEAIVLAEAGLTRLGLAHRITQVLPVTWMLPAVGQGALALETRGDDARTRDWVAPLDDADTHAAVTAERSLLAALRGGCLAPVGAWGRVESGTLLLDAAVLDPQGQQRVATHCTGPPQDAQRVGQQAAQHLLDQGAAALIAQARAQ